MTRLLYSSLISGAAEIDEDGIASLIAPISLANPDMLFGDGVLFNHAPQPFEVSVPDDKVLTLLDLKFRNTSATGGMFYGLRIITDSDVADSAAGIAISNWGHSDALYIGVSGKTGSPFGNSPTGIGIDVNISQSGVGESASARSGMSGIQIYDRSTTDQGSDGPLCIFLNKLGNLNAQHIALKLRGNRNLIKMIANSSVGGYDPAFPAIVLADEASGAELWHLRVDGSMLFTQDAVGILFDSGSGVGGMWSSRNDLQLRNVGAGGSILLLTQGGLVILRAMDDLSTHLSGPLNLAAVTPTARAGDVFYDAAQIKHGTYSSGLLGWLERCIWSGYAEVNHVGAVTAQSLFTATALGSRALPANFWKVGKALRVRLQGHYTTDAVPGTATITVKFGAATFRTTGAFGLDTNVTDGFWAMDFAIVCESVGATGTLNGALSWTHAQSTGGGSEPMHSERFTTHAPVTIDTTAAATFDVVWSASDAGTSIHVDTARVWEVA